MPEEPREQLLGYLRTSVSEANRRGITTGVNASGSIRETHRGANFLRIDFAQKASIGPKLTTPK